MAASLAIASTGCGIADAFGLGACDRSKDGNPLVWYTEGEVENGVYMSSQPDAELLYFPGGMRYRIAHKLGQRPRSWEFSLSFAQKGANEGNGAVSPAAGNQVELRCVDDKDMVVVNGSCAEYWLLVTASAGAVDGSGGGGGSDGSGSGGSDGSGGGGGGAPLSCEEQEKSTP